jgi:hypothetical protein
MPPVMGRTALFSGVLVVTAILAALISSPHG